MYLNMTNLWIVFCCIAAISASKPSTATLQLDLLSSLQFDEDVAGEKTAHSLERHIRAVGAVSDSLPFTYEVDVEIAIPPDKVQSLTEFFKNQPLILEVINNSAVVGNVTSAAVSTVCNESECTCESGFLWDPTVCSTQACHRIPVNASCTCINITSTYGVCEPEVPSTTTASPTTNISTAVHKSLCNDAEFGIGEEGTISSISCPRDPSNQKQAICMNGVWNKTKDDCTAIEILNLLDMLQSNPLNVSAAAAMELLVNLTLGGKTSVTKVANIYGIVKVFDLLTKSPVKSVSETTMTNFMTVTDVIVSNNSLNSWTNLSHTNTSSVLLQSVENFTRLLSTKNESIDITNENIELRGIKLSPQNSNANFNSSLLNGTSTVFIPSDQMKRLPIDSLVLSIGYPTLSEILPQNFRQDNKNLSINGIVISVTVNGTIDNVTLTFRKTNTSLQADQCVFWNFNTYNWTNTCTKQDNKQSVTCFCNHLTSFSTLMSPNTISLLWLDWITYIGVGISMGSLAICLIIEGIVWNFVIKNKTSYMRHVSIVNVAVSLLIADIWFIIGASLPENGGIPNAKLAACKTATFFIQYFYLCLFFWMLILGLMLFYRLVLVFHDMSRSTMRVTAFSVGYGCPLIITVITIAVTEPQTGQLHIGSYIRSNACWLNWDDTMALLAFIIPVLCIIAVNLVILLVVITKILCPSTGNLQRMDERSALLKVARIVATLTPLLGLTWGFGIGTVVDNQSIPLHVIFTVLNAFQGFFILLVGTLLDHKVRNVFSNKFPWQRWRSQQTTSTSAGTTNRAAASRAFTKMFGKKGEYNFSSGGRSTFSSS